MKDLDKLQKINQQIEALQLRQKQLEEKYINDISQKIIKMIFKKNVFEIDKAVLIKEIERAIDNLLNISNKSFQSKRDTYESNSKEQTEHQ